MELRKLRSYIEAIIFASGEPIAIERLSDTLKVEKDTIARTIISLNDFYEENDSALIIVKLENKYQMCTKSEYAEIIRQALDYRRNLPLSQAALEVLAIVAYNQPVTKAFIEQVRGVDCSGVVTSLVSKQLIEEAGRLELPGRPISYKTTSNFLRCFSLDSIEKLPPLPSKEEISAEEGFSDQEIEDMELQEV